MHKLLKFKNKNLLRQALTHRSYLNENVDENQHNERLEFLGDAILNFISGEYLYRHEPEMEEDEMTRRRAAFVDEKQLAKFALEIGLEYMMRLGKGAIQTGGYQNPNLLSSTFEAVVGAYYIDSGRDIEAVRTIVEELFESVPKQTVASRAKLDSKNRLQELVQAKITAQLFLASVYVGTTLSGEGRGCSKKEAEKLAAEDALTKLKQQGF
jgi:ribonuclease III